MRLSTKGRYGIKAILDLALNSEEGQVSLKSIAQRQGLSESYLEQLFAAMRKAGIVTSTRGAQGGYILADKPENITVGKVLRSLEGSLAPVDCVTEENASKCDRSEECVTRIVWEKIRDSVNQVVDSMTIKMLMDEYRKTCSSDNLQYTI